ncbi:unnamed protein product [Rhizophagus irregularis]|nr:unnamed protein product [Rhizophagus irregularis]
MESIVSEPEPTVKQTNKRKQTTLNHYRPSFTKQDQEELESLLVRVFCSTGIPFNDIDFQAFLQKALYTKEEHHTGENIAKGIEDCVISIGIDKFTAVITDNANNMKSAWRILKENDLQRIQKEKYGYEIALTLTIKTRWMSAFECLDFILKTKIAMRALLVEENISLNQEIKNYIIDDCFWEELKNFRDYWNRL